MAEFMMPLRNLFQWVSEFPTSIAIRESLLFSPYLTVAHVVSMCLFAGLIVMMDLRLLGIGNMSTPFSELQKRLFPWQMLGMAMSSVTGLTLAYSDPDALLRQHLLLDEDAGDGAGGYQRHGVSLHHVQLGGDVGLEGDDTVRSQAVRCLGDGAVGDRHRLRTAHPVQLVPELV